MIPLRGSLTWWAPWALPVSAPPARDVLVTARDGRISDLRARVRRDDAIAAGAVVHDDCVIAPGFVNAHAHLEYAAYDALVDGLGFTEWIGDHMHRKRRLTPEQDAAGALLGAREALHAGITCVGDASFSGASARAMHEVGLRGRVYLEVFGGTDDEREAARIVDEARRRLAELPVSQLLQHGLSPHAPYTVGEALYRATAAAGMPWMTHLLESSDEVAFVSGGGPMHDALDRAGIAAPSWRRPPLEQLRDVLGPHVVAVHMTQATPADVELIADTGTAVAHCPRSNARLGCGLFDLALADRAGVLVGLGTDSPASAGPLDPFAELRSALEQHRAGARDPTWPSTARLLRAATLDAARTLGYDDLGSLDIGSHADIVAVHVGPCDDPLAAYVLGATPADVQAVAIAGIDAAVRDTTALNDARAGAVDARHMLALPVRRGASQRVPG